MREAVEMSGPEGRRKMIHAQIKSSILEDRLTRTSISIIAWNRRSASTLALPGALTTATLILGFATSLPRRTNRPGTTLGSLDNLGLRQRT